MPTPIAARASGRALLLLALACLGVPPAHAAVSFREEVAPILVEKCLACHNAEHRKGSYRLDTFERLKQPGESGELPLQPGDPGNSPLYRLLVHPDAGERMPKKAAPLSGGELGAIRAWIEEGALFDGPSEEVPLAQYARLIYPDPPERYGTAVPVTALAFAASGKALYCGGEHELLVWDLAEGRITRRIPRLPRRLHLLLALPDGERLVAAGGEPGRSGEVLLLRPGPPAAVHSLLRSQEPVLAAAVSRDGERVAVGTVDGLVRLYRVDTGETLWQMPHHADWITSLDFSPDGALLVSASRDRTVRVIRAQDGELEAVYPQHEAAVLAVAVEPGGRLAVSSGRDNRLHAWSLADAKQVRKQEGVTSEVARLLSTPEGWLAGGSDRKVWLLAPGLAKGAVELGAHQEWIAALAWSAEAGLAASGSLDGEVRIWNLKERREIGRFRAQP